MKRNMQQMVWGKWAGKKGIRIVKHKNRNNPEAIKRLVLCRLKGHYQYSSVTRYNGTTCKLDILCGELKPGEDCGLLATTNMKLKGVKAK
jgi:hypothetical protein